MTESLEIAERTLGLARAGDELQAVVQRELSALARFAGSEVHQPTIIDNCVVHAELVRDGRLGTASTNRLDDDGLAAVVQRAREAAASASPDPDFPGLAEPAAIAQVDGYDEQTAALSPEEQATLATTAIGATNGLGAYGYVTSGVCELAIASTTGVRADQRFTDVGVRVLAADNEISGFAEQTASAVGAIDVEATAREAVEKAERTRDASGLEPGVYRAVLEPYALGELLQWFSYSAFNALAVLEERSSLTGRLGQPFADAKLSLVDDALDPSGLPKAFDFEGSPKERVTLIEDGVAMGLVWDRATAARAGRGQRSTGHALTIAERSYGPLPLALAVQPGEAASTGELAELVDDGIYITRLHYLGIVDPRAGILTGMTRDGTFRIRGGTIAEPLVNLRFTVAVPELLADIPGLTRSRTLVNQSDFYDERYPFAALVPALATAHFAVTGTGSAPGL
jgi:predicted Zn-dependent protease